MAKKQTPKYTTKEKRRIARATGFDPKTADRMRYWSDERFTKEIRKKEANNRRNEKYKARRQAFKEAGYQPADYEKWVYRSEDFVQQMLRNRPKIIAIGVYDASEKLDPTEVMGFIHQSNRLSTAEMEEVIENSITTNLHFNSCIGYSDVNIYDSRAEAEEYLTDNERAITYIGTGISYRYIIRGMAAASLVMYHPMDKAIMVDDVIAMLYQLNRPEASANADRLRARFGDIKVAGKKPKKY